MAVAVGLDDRAQLAIAHQLGAQACAVALDRRHVHPSDDSPAAHATPSPSAPAADLLGVGRLEVWSATGDRRTEGSAAITSEAIAPSAPPSRRAASRPACTCRNTPAAAAANGSTRWASNAAITPLSTSPLP